VTLRVLGDDRDAIAALDNVERRRADLESHPALLRVDVQDADALRQLYTVGGAMRELGGMTARPSIDLSGTGLALSQIATVDAALRSLGGVVLRRNIGTGFLAGAAGAAAGAAAGGGGGGGGGGGSAAAAAAGAAAGGGGRFFTPGGGLFGLGGSVALAGGLLGTIPLWQVLIHSIVEIGAVLIPATIAMGAFGIAGAAAAHDIYTNFQNTQTAIGAVGGKLPALSGGFAAVQAAVKPQVLTLFGEGLDLVNKQTGAFRTLATGAGNDLIQFANRAVLAFQSTGSFASTAVKDLGLLLNIIGNVGGTIGNLLHAVPGIAGVLFHGIDLATSGLEHFTSSGFVQGITKVVLGLHGAVVWGGLAATAMIALGTKLAAVGEGAAGFISTGLPVVLSKLAAFGSSPWGWATIGVAILAGLFVALHNVKDATITWLDSLQQRADQATVFQMLPTYMSNVAKVSAALAANQNTLADSSHNVSQSYVTLRFGIDTAAQSIAARGVELTDGLRQQQVAAGRLNALFTTLRGSFNLTRGQVEGLTVQMTGSQKAATALWDSYVHGKMTLAQLVNEYKSYFLATTGMIPTTERARAAVYELGKAASDTEQNVQALNKAEDMLMQQSTGLAGSQISLRQGMAQLRTDLHATGASFTGLNANALTLQSDFENSFISPLVGVKDGLQEAGANTHQMSQIIATDMLPAVKDGAFQNKAFASQLMAVGREAGYNGPNNIKSFIRWVENAAGPVSSLTRLVNGLAGSIAAIPSIPGGSGGGGGGHATTTNTGAKRPYAAGGWIREPVVGIGLSSHQTYSFAENAPELVVPSGGGDVHIHNHYHGVAVPDDVAQGIHKGLLNYKRHMGGQALGFE